MDEEGQRRFESELSWCLDHLTSLLESNKLSEKQARDTLQAAKCLRNPKAPLAKKRQMMRVSCGDYRAKMETEEKKFKLEAAVEEHVSPSKSSRFFKRSMQQRSTGETSEAPFKFNFSPDSVPLVVASTKQQQQQESATK